MELPWISVIIVAVYFIAFFLLLGAMLGVMKKYIDEEIHLKKKDSIESSTDK